MTDNTFQQTRIDVSIKDEENKMESKADSRYTYLLKVKGLNDMLGNSVKTEYVVRASSSAEAIEYAQEQANRDGIYPAKITFFFKTTQAAYRDGILIHDAADGSVQENTIHRDFECERQKAKDNIEKDKKVKEWMETMLRSMTE